MAEAHAAVAFSFQITHEGFEFQFDKQLLQEVWESGLRSWKKGIARFKNNIKNGVYPASLSSLLFTVSGITGFVLAQTDPSFGLIPWFQLFMPSYIASYTSLMIGCFIYSFLLWLVLILTMKYTLRLLLRYKGWMYDPHNKMSTLSKMWLMSVKLFQGSLPLLYSYQFSLPKLPVPSLDDTMTRYLRSVKPLLSEEEYNKMEFLANEFKNGIGRKLQRYLVLKSWWANNYVSDWWEEYVYLRGRTPLMVNSNFYAVDALFLHPTYNQAARAANMIHVMLQFRRLLDRQEIKPIMLQNTVPLCSWQYERIFNTTRIPGIETDTLRHLNDSYHIIVYHKGKFFKVIIYFRGRILKPSELEIQMQKILDDSSLPQEGEERLGALTAAERKPWAEARKEYFSKGVNKTSLDAIDKAAFFVVLDDEEQDFDRANPDKLDSFGCCMLHGKGYNRWFDKSFTLVVLKNARVGLNVEHSWADAPVVGHLWEYSLLEEIIFLGYTDDGHTVGEPEFDSPSPIRLKWEISQECQKVIDNSYQVAVKLLNDLDLRLLMFDRYGKGFIKKCRVSPDAYLQMALQLAYFRDAGKFNLTYEASMTRLFREGRTETVRPVTLESCAFVRGMEDKLMSKEEQIKLLNTACEVHQSLYRDAMSGKGIDRHLFCLYVVSKYLEVDSPFLQKVLSEPWRLSTSQTPHSQTDRMDLRKYPNHISAGGGFGPVADDGYGVSYIIAGEDIIFFHISSKVSSPETKSHRFSNNIEQALIDMKNLFSTEAGNAVKK